MTRTLEEVISEIKNGLDIVEVVSEQVILKKSGNHYWGLCPFHKEKTPSFSVNPQLGIYKCFGCGEGGDALSFIMKTKNMEFMDVIKDLAQKYGIEMPVTFKKEGETKDFKRHVHNLHGFGQYQAKDFHVITFPVKSASLRLTSAKLSWRIFLIQGLQLLSAGFSIICINF